MTFITQVPKMLLRVDFTPIAMYKTFLLLLCNKEYFGNDPQVQWTYTKH